MPTGGFAPVDETNEVSSQAKAQCNCGCKADTSSWAPSMGASSEFKRALEGDVQSLLNKAKQVKLNGHQSTAFEILPLKRTFRSPDTPDSVHHVRLQTLVRVLQSSFFSPEAGAYPAAIDWTSTVLATHLINYFQQTSDHRYFSHLVAFYHKQNVSGLIRQNYDDQLWVVLTFLRGAAYAATCEPEWVDPFLERASIFYELARSGWDDETCGGGMVWGRWARYKNAVTTELWIAASIGMYEVLGEDRMLEAASRAWAWLKRSGMFNEEGLVNDGLDSNCQNNRQMTWTYNQGILLSGLSGLYKFTQDESLVQAAQNLIDSVLASYLVPKDSGVLVESCDPFRTCNQDQWMFKGIFFQHLGYFLQDISELESLDLSSRQSLLEKYSSFIRTNACAVWDVARQKDGKIGNWWDGPPGEEIRRQVSVETHGSGVGAVLCAVRIGDLMTMLKTEAAGVKDFEKGIKELGLCGERWNKSL